MRLHQAAPTATQRQIHERAKARRARFFRPAARVAAARIETVPAIVTPAATTAAASPCRAQQRAMSAPDPGRLMTATGARLALIKRAVADEFGLTIEELLARTREPHICGPRQIAI